MMQSNLQIGQVATRAGVSVDAVRYYERRRLLLRPQRTGGGFRLFTPETVERIRFIKQAQELGFSLDEIGELLTTGGAEECHRVRDLLQAKLVAVDEKVKAMRTFRRTLSAHLNECERELAEKGKAAHCPVVQIRRA